MTKEVYYLLVPPGAQRPGGWEAVNVWLFYRLGRRGAEPLADPRSLRGGVMGIACDSPGESWDTGSVCRSVERECLARGYGGVLLDGEEHDPALGRLVGALGETLRRRGLILFLPEQYAHLVPGARVVLSSALSGGSLEGRLGEGLSRFGSERMVLGVERSGEDFALPALTGCGQALSWGELEELRNRIRPCIYFSRPLCARYFTYQEGSGVHFVLFDDADTLKRKVEMAKAAGVSRFLLPWPEVCADPGAFGVPRRRP